MGHQGIPEHIAIIMDGNGRWARAKGKPRVFGHRQGSKQVRKIVKHATELGLKALSLYAFSTENWQRPKTEIKLLMQLFLSLLKKETPELDNNNIKLRIIGDKNRFSKNLQAEIKKSEATTATNSGMVLNVAASYGGRWEIAQAVKQIVRDVQAGDLNPDEINESHLSRCLLTSGLPEPDLFIRTGGDKRISNFLIWQIAYSELYFTDVSWPDFDKEQFDKAIAWYAKRERKFGKTSEQVSK